MHFDANYSYKEIEMENLAFCWLENVILSIFEKFDTKYFFIPRLFFRVNYLLVIRIFKIKVGSIFYCAIILFIGDFFKGISIIFVS